MNLKLPTLALALGLSFSAVKAQVFTSGAFALDGSSVEDVGPVVEAVKFYRFNNATVDINNVTFTNVYGQVSGTSGSNFTLNSQGVDGTGGGTNGASQAVLNLTDEGVYDGSNLQLTNLSAGTQYAVQLIFDADSQDYRTASVTDHSITSATVTGGVPGPQFITDTFTAGSSTESLSISGGLELSGLVLEETPEPGTWALLGLGLAGFVWLARRRLVRA